jgi:4-diphosphocytidyl-2-C-methyl-D-erythritol kinase
MGAGLGGGSSNGVAALKALNAVSGRALSAEHLAEIAARLGSDCPLFLKEGPVVMRGRGERVDALPADAVARLADRKVLVFKPAFGIPTPWAYSRMASDARTYLSPAHAEARLGAWLADGASAIEDLLFNSLEQVAFAKFVALPVLLERLRREFGLQGCMSGSGSACFAFLREDHSIAAITNTIRSAWGANAFVVAARILPSPTTRGSGTNPH